MLKMFVAQLTIKVEVLERSNYPLLSKWHASDIRH